MMDASKTGWGTLCHGRPAFGSWTEPMPNWHINCLEMMAMLQGGEMLGFRCLDARMVQLLSATPWPIPLRRDLLSQVGGQIWYEHDL